MRRRGLCAGRLRRLRDRDLLNDLGRHFEHSLCFGRPGCLGLDTVGSGVRGFRPGSASGGVSTSESAEGRASSVSSRDSSIWTDVPSSTEGWSAPPMPSVLTLS